MKTFQCFVKKYHVQKYLFLYTLHNFADITDNKYYLMIDKNT